MPSKFPFDIGERVIYDDVSRNYKSNTGEGEVIGLFMLTVGNIPPTTYYIVLLDKPLKMKGKSKPLRGLVAQNSGLSRIFQGTQSPLDNEE